MILENITLNFTDLTGSKTGCTKLGSNKFWKGWVEDLGNGVGNFECRWGPTGDPGSDKGSKRGIPLTEALHILHSKTKEKQGKGYTLVETRTDHEEICKMANITTTKSPIISATKFHPDIARLLGTIYGETSRVICAGLSAQAGATAENPIGNLSDRQLDLGGSILEEIELLLRTRLGRESTANKTQLLPPLDSQVIDLTNRYMSAVPRAITRDQRGSNNLQRLVVASYERLEEQRKFLQLLRDAYLSKDVFQAAAHTVSDKEQVWYDGLNCDIELCDQKDFDRVASYFNTGQSKKNLNWFRGNQSILKVLRVFKFTRKGTKERFDSYSDRILKKSGAAGKIMAWHGTRTENLLGIGKSGLLLPENLPRGVHISGKAFGKGIYHAPAWNATGHKLIGGYPTDGTNGALKSMNYTSAQGAYYGSGNQSHNAFMFLQEVALGIPDVKTSACWDKNRPDDWPTKDFIFACAAKNQGGFTHDELVTFDQDAQIFRYLVEITLV